MIVTKYPLEEAFVDMVKSFSARWRTISRWRRETKQTSRAWIGGSVSHNLTDPPATAIQPSHMTTQRSEHMTTQRSDEKND